MNDKILLTEDLSTEKNTLPEQMILGMRVVDMVHFSFLEQSAKYFGVYFEQDPLQLKSDKYLIN